VETLQVNAQTEKFPNLNTKNEDGYQFIQNTFNDIMVNTRGFKKDTPQIVDKAEKRVVFTTMKK
jgi:predicted phage-related endonuclease